jgi:class 3 adenylate cyclase
MGLFKTRPGDYGACEHGIRSHLRKDKWDQFSPAILDLGDLSAAAVERDAVCAVFDLAGFTRFCSQPDPQLVLPDFLSAFLHWLFDAIKASWIVKHYRDPQPGYVPAYTRLPFFAKFTGDGVLFLWDVSDLEEPAVCNIPGLLIDLLVEYQRDFLPKVQRTVVSAPSALRCGIARGKVFSVGQGNDFVGPCMNIASRLQKVGHLTFAVSRRGFDADRHASPAVRQSLILKRLAIRDIGNDELVWLDSGSPTRRNVSIGSREALNRNSDSHR